MRFSDAKILLTGGSGFLGHIVNEKLVSKGVPKDNIIIPRSATHDLRIKEHCLELTKGADIVIHLAANVGGIGKNKEVPADLFYDNAVMGIELMHAAHLNNVKKFVCVGTICSYPKFTDVPFREEDLWGGYPEETNAAYGLAKKMLLVQSQAYRQQYGLNAIYLLVANLYGPRDNFDPYSSHVIPALIQKIHEAKVAQKKEIEVWGDGSPSRDFLYVEDAASAIVQSIENYDGAEPVNVGTGLETTIKHLVEEIQNLMGFEGEIRWNKKKPNGQPRRVLDVSKAKQLFGFEAQTKFRKGLKQTIDWYLSEK